MKWVKIILAGAVITAVITVACTKKDLDAPIVVLKGKRIDTVDLHKPYTELGATATDIQDGDLTSLISITGSPDTANAGFYAITYRVTDKAGNTGEAVRTVMVRHTPRTVSGNYTVSDACVGSPSSYNDFFIADTLTYLRASRFGNYDSANVYISLSGQTNSVFAVPQQTVSCGTPAAARVFAGTGTISPNGKSMVINYVVLDAVNAYTCSGTYVK